MRAGNNEDGRGIFKSFEGSSKREGLDGGNKWNEIMTLPELLAGLEDDKRPNNSWYQLGNTWNDERNNKRKLEESILGEREEGAVEPNTQWNNHLQERQEEAADWQKSTGGLNIHQLCHEVIRQHLNTVRKGEHNDTREGCGQQQHDTIHKTVITALCRSKNEVAFKDDGKKGILISLQKPNIDIISSSSFADKCSPHHQQLFKMPGLSEVFCKLLRDAVLAQDTQLPATDSSDGSLQSSTSTLRSFLSASTVPKEADQYPVSSTRSMLSTKTRRIRSKMRRQAEKKHKEWCNLSSSSEDLD